MNLAPHQIDMRLEPVGVLGKRQWQHCVCDLVFDLVELFQKIVAGAALDAGVDAVILQRQGGAADHPTALAFPEGEYLKGLVLMRRPD